MGQSKKKKAVAKKKNSKPKVKASKKATKSLKKAVSKSSRASSAKGRKAPKLKSSAVKSSRPTTLNFAPLDDRVLVRTQSLNRTPGGLIIPATVEDRPQEGVVVAVGRGHRDKKGRLRPMDVRVGDRVLFAALSGSPLEINGEEFMVLRESELLAIHSR